MHPLLSPISRFGLYSLAWLPPMAILVYLMAIPGQLGWTSAAALVIPLCIIYEFICLSAWYSCRSLPIQGTTVERLLLTHLVAAAVISLLWIGAAKILAYALSQTHAFASLYARFSTQLAILFGAGVLLYLLSVAFHYVLLSLDESRKAETRVMESGILARDAELKALKAQVNPHFLFNSLNSISALTSIDAGRAREMCILLAEFLRMTLGLGEKNIVPLREELDLLQRFLAIEKVRFGSRLTVDIEIDAQAESCLVPPLILQPLVENAIVHGIANLPDGGTVRLNAHCEGGRLHFLIENSVDPDAPLNRKGGGLGLANVRQRIEARYPKDSSVRAVAEDEIFRVFLSLPAEFAPAHPSISPQENVALTSAPTELDQTKQVRG